MLEKLRDASKTWVAAIFIGALIISFAIWGINDIFSGRRSTAIAKVNGVELDVRTFEQEFNQRLRRMTKPDGRPMTAAEARAQNLDRLVLNDIISNMAVLDAASRAGFVATDEMVRKEIANISGGEKKIPSLRFGLADMAGKEVYQWTLDAGARPLKSGESTSFVTRVASPPEAAKNVQIRFAHADEIGLNPAHD
jgi:hypothetical protein